MQFSRESQYFNRYSRSRGYQEWRALAGEVPQSAEFNEIQSLLSDRINQNGQAVFQNGDVISGLSVVSELPEDTETPGEFTLYNTIDSMDHKIWCDGVVHTVPSAKNIPVTNSGWGFIGVFFEKFTVSASEDPNLRDPSVYNGSGQYLGLPGANRLKVVPVWVAGTLHVSEYDELAIKSTTCYARPASGSYIELTPEVDLVEQVSDKSVYNAKFNINKVNANSVEGDTKYLDILVKQLSPTEIKKIKNISSKIKVVLPANSGSVSFKASVNFFTLGSKTPQVSMPSSYSYASGNTSHEITFNTQAKINELALTNVGYYIGLTIETQTPFPSGTKFYLSDFYWSETTTDERRPVFQKFKTLTGSEYYNYIPGPSNYLKVGDQTVLSGIANVTTVSGNALIRSSENGYISIPADFQALGLRDVVIREKEITDDSTFYSTYGISKEDLCLRVYPIHITKDGQIKSSLPNREFTGLTNNYFSERFKNLLDTQVVTDYSIKTGFNRDYTFENINAVVEGRYITNTDAKIVLPNFESSSESTYDFNILYTGTSTVNYSLPTRFKTITGSKIKCIIREEVTRKQPLVQDYSTLNAEQKDLLGLHVLGGPSANQIESVRLLQIRNVEINANSEQKEGSFYYNLHDQDVKLDYTTKTVTNNGQSYSYVFPTIRWENRGTYPVVGEKYVVYYEADILVNIINSSNSNSQLQLKGNDLSQTSNDYGTLSVLTKNQTSELDITLLSASGEMSGLSPILYDKFNYNDGKETKTFQSTISGTATAGTLDCFIIYLSADYYKYGPDGRLDYIKVREAEKDSASIALLANNKLPLAFIKSGENPQKIAYRGLSQAEKRETQNLIADLKRYLPALLSQSILASDTSAQTAPVIQYVASDKAAEKYLVKKVSWQIDPARFPTLDKHTIVTTYDYYGDDEPSTITSRLSSDHIVRSKKESDDFNGLLRSFTVEIKNLNTQQSLETFTAVILYHENTPVNLDVNGSSNSDSFDDPPDCPLIRHIDII
jgi:hypothetical protein